MMYAKECIKIGRKGAMSTADFTELFGVKYDPKFNRLAAKSHLINTPEEKDYIITAMANTIMDLTSNGKFNLREF